MREVLKAIPGLAPAYRGLRGLWRRLRLGEERRRVAGVWGTAAVAHPEGGDPRVWYTSEQVLRDYIFPQFGGVDWYTHVRARYCPRPREMGLSLGCGNGFVERWMVHVGICRGFLGLDVAPQAVHVCTEAARAAGYRSLRYRVADLERLRLPRGRYDLVVGWCSLYHVSNLRGLFGEVRWAMRPGGVFVVNEYVGPRRLQVTPRQGELINEWLERLPEELRLLPSGQVRRGFVPASEGQVAAADPSEAVASDTILPLLAEHFEVVERVDLGGALLHWLLHDIVQNFDPGNAEHRAWLARLYGAEREAMARGEIGSDFVFAVAKRREG